MKKLTLLLIFCFIFTGCEAEYMNAKFLPGDFVKDKKTGLVGIVSDIGNVRKEIEGKSYATYHVRLFRGTEILKDNVKVVGISYDSYGKDDNLRQESELEEISVYDYIKMP